MRILLTGATGLIGTEVGIELVRRGHEVIAVSKDPKDARHGLPFPCEVYEWHGEKHLLPKAATQNIDAVIHLAGENIAAKPWTEERKKELFESRIASTRHLIESFSSFPKIGIIASAIGFYGDRGENEVTEISGPGAGFLADLCLAWESQAQKLLEPQKVRLVHLRTAPVLSRMGGFLDPIVSLFLKGLGGPIGNGKQWMSWIHIQDVVRAILFCLEREEITGAVNLCSPEPITNLEFTKLLAKKLKKPSFLAAPKFALKLAMKEMSELVLASIRAKPEVLQKHGYGFLFSNLQAALDNLFGDKFADALMVHSRQWLPLTDSNKLAKVKPLEQPLKNLIKDSFHEETIEQLGSGTLVTDKVYLHLPFGLIGNLASTFVVNRVRELLDERKLSRQQLFGRRMIGLTGNIACGKSTVAKTLLELGIPVIDADAISREVSAKGEEGYRKIVKEFGEEVLDKDGPNAGEINRAKLRELVFESETKENRRKLEALLHPLIIGKSREKAQKYFDEGHNIVVLEASLMVEAKSYRDLDGVLLVTCPSDKQMQNLLKRNPDLSEDLATKMINSQLSQEEKRKVSTWVIENTGTIEELQEKTRIWLKEIMG
ncbi:MAG: TIGR01777 family oxidoreductase [Bacteriovoracia bacterium]